MTKDEKYNEYLILCKEINEVPFPKEDNKWATHKGKLVQNKPKEYSEQTAADDYLDYLDSRY